MLDRQLKSMTVLRGKGSAMIWNQVRHLAAGSIILLASVTTLMAQSSADRPGNEIEIRGVYSIPSGEASFSTSGSSGSIISFDRDFGFRNELGFQLRYTHKSANNKHKFLVDYAETDWQRSTTLSRSVTFLGETYLANLNTTSDLKLRSFRAMYSYRWGNDKIRFGPMVDAGVVAVRLNISGTTNNGVRTAEGSITKLAATVGYDLDYDPLPSVSIFHNLGGIVFQGQHLFHTEGGVKYFPVRHIGVTGGYKFERYRLEDGSNFVTVKKHGPFVGGVFRF
jgi:hypothetical protein